MFVLEGISAVVVAEEPLHHLIFFFSFEGWTRLKFENEQNLVFGDKKKSPFISLLTCGDSPVFLHPLYSRHLCTIVVKMSWFYLIRSFSSLFVCKS